MLEYYHLAPVVLTDALFFEYAPTCSQTGTATQRHAAFTIAEQQMIQHLGTFLLPTTVTGTFVFPVPMEPLVLPYSHLISIDRVVAKSLDGCDDCDLTDHSGCGIIRDSVGYIDIRVVSQAAKSLCGSCAGVYYQLEVTATAGLPTGVAANDHGLHMALAKLAEVTLAEMVDPGANEGGPGDPGLSAWSSQGYSETRMPLKTTAMGSGPMANYIARLVRHLRKYRALRFR
jgi:hypothetical protein